MPVGTLLFVSAPSTDDRDGRKDGDRNARRALAPAMTHPTGAVMHFEPIPFLAMRFTASGSSGIFLQEPVFV
nr:hypothetical protein [Gammaproteobacteria bacterium]